MGLCAFLRGGGEIKRFLQKRNAGKMKTTQSCRLRRYVESWCKSDGNNNKNNNNTRINGNLSVQYISNQFISYQKTLRVVIVPTKAA